MRRQGQATGGMTNPWMPRPDRGGVTSSPGSDRPRFALIGAKTCYETRWQSRRDGNKHKWGFPKVQRTSWAL
ncbi:unnamed protein product [Lota lota]